MAEGDDGLESSQLEQIFMQLASGQRRAILSKLNEKSLKLSELAKELGATVQHAHNNVNRLIDVGMIEKNPGGSLDLTAYGQGVLRQLSTFEFLAKHRDYFLEHTFGDLPLKFEHRIGDLNNCSVVRGVAAVLQRWKLMYNEAREYINTITSQVLVDLIEPLAEKVRSGTNLSYVMPEDVIIPEGTAEATRTVSWKSLLAEAKAQRRMVKKVLISTIVTDNAAGVMFPNLKNEVDMNVMLYSKDPVFHEWCHDYFRHVWDSSDLFNESVLRREI